MGVHLFDYAAENANESQVLHPKSPIHQDGAFGYVTGFGQME